MLAIPREKVGSVEAVTRVPVVGYRDDRKANGKNRRGKHECELSAHGSTGSPQKYRDTSAWIVPAVRTGFMPPDPVA